MDQSRKAELLQKDRKYVWHPFTQMKDYANQDHVLIEKAEGIFLYDADGNRYYDTVSSWWVNTHGHAHPRIKQAIIEQLEQMDHVMFSGLTHAQGIELAEKLVQITPEGLTKVFYSDNGSTAVEVALKMSFQYWQQVGKTQKTRFAYLDNGYHGDTLGAVSVGGVDLYHSLYKPLLFSAYRVAAPQLFQWPDASAAGEDACVAAALADVKQLFETSAHELAGIIVEPMIQAAGGMNIYPAAYLKGLRELCTEHAVHLIADEVAVGFGRTGRWFACNHADVSPDIICLSKALTAGVLPLAATLCTEEIYQAFYDDYDRFKTFFHGHSFTGNPVGAAVALASLQIFEEEQVMRHVSDASAHLSVQMERFREFEHVANIRALGMVAAFDLVADRETKQGFDEQDRAGYQIYLEGLEEGLILRPLGDTIYFWLPLATTTSDIDEITRRTMRVLQRKGM
ncbi:MAG: adenosylmethionine--8-amino-7-oxononanoate aminotransferase BioA [Bacilli bacterium]|nr:adenosylmethionine--8-amino-7-oxononanoate aminotransferase BioA [Bacilli bacterium]